MNNENCKVTIIIIQYHYCKVSTLTLISRLEFFIFAFLNYVLFQLNILFRLDHCSKYLIFYVVHL